MGYTTLRGTTEVLDCEITDRHDPKLAREPVSNPNLSGRVREATQDRSRNDVVASSHLRAQVDRVIPLLSDALRAALAHLLEDSPHSQIIAVTSDIGDESGVQARASSL